MSLDGKLLARAKRRLDAMRADKDSELERRRHEAYSRDPHIRELDSMMRGTVIDAIGIALKKGGDPAEALENIRDRSLELQEERGLRLSYAGFPADYLSDGYMCPKCRDTGYNGTEICSCLMELYREEQVKDLSALLKLGEETFDNFDLNLYSDEPDPRTGISPRQNMEIVFETCSQYARKFSKDSLNLFLSGGTGLGKTFLSTCIAKTVSEQGFSVFYDTASSVFQKFEKERFSRNPEEAAEAAADVRRLEKCDLLILDDLGTELPGALVTSALYTLLNTRLTGGKKTVISSNLTMKELGSRYSAPIMSRLEGEFVVLRFSGTDIRRIKNGLI